MWRRLLCRLFYMHRPIIESRYWEWHRWAPIYRCRHCGCLYVGYQCRR